MNTEKVQRCGCEEGDCVEILGLESPVYACFTCGYAGVTPSGADDYRDEIHIGGLLAEVKRLRSVLAHHDECWNCGLHLDGHPGPVNEDCTNTLDEHGIIAHGQEGNA